MIGSESESESMCNNENHRLEGVGKSQNQSEDPDEAGDSDVGTGKTNVCHCINIIRAGVPPGEAPRRDSPRLIADGGTTAEAGADSISSGEDDESIKDKIEGGETVVSHPYDGLKRGYEIPTSILRDVDAEITADDIDRAVYIAISERRADIVRMLLDDPHLPSECLAKTGYRYPNVSGALRELREKGIIDLLVPEETKKGRLYGMTDQGRLAAEIADQLGGDEGPEVFP